ncbi:MAG: universal stress protein [Chloroflexota bacterium]
MKRSSSSTRYKRILVPFDGSEGSSKALQRALLLAKDQGAEVTIFYVDEHLPRYAKGVGEIQEAEEVREAEAAELRSKALALARRQGMEVKFETVVGHAAQSILSYAQEEAFDVIVIGHTGHSGLWGTLLGSTTARVVDQATSDVLVVR